MSCKAFLHAIACIIALNLSVTRDLARLAVLASLGREAELRRFMGCKSLGAIPATMITETLLQVHLFAGYPASIEGLKTASMCLPKLRTLRKTRAPMSLHHRRVSGAATCKKVYGSKYLPLLDAMRNLHPDLKDWMVEDGYGKVLSRKGLTLQDRELISVATLAALGWERQLQSHIMGCRNVGLKRSDIISILQSVRLYAAKSKIRRAVAGVNRVFPQKKA